MSDPTKTAWWRKVTPYFLGACLWLVLSNLYNRAFPDHPAPAAVEADGKTYVACSTPDTGRGWFHSTYYADFKDNNGQVVSLRGVEHLTVTNLPQETDAPMPTPGTDDMSYRDSDGKPLVEGRIYNWDDGTEARWKEGKWVPVKIENRVCESDDAREKRQAQEEETRRAQRKEKEAKATARLLQTCKEWEGKHPLGSPVDVWAQDGSALAGSTISSPAGCEGPLETAYDEKMKREQASLAKEYAAQEAAKQKTKSRTTSVSTHHWATANSQYAFARTIYKRCHFNVDSSASCGYANEEEAELQQGDRVEILSSKTRSASGTEIYEVRFHSWTGWMDAADLTLDTE
jgi:hypothetical protein